MEPPSGSPFEPPRGPTPPSDPYADFGPVPTAPQPPPYGFAPRGPEYPGVNGMLTVAAVSLGLGFACGLGFLGSPVALVMGLVARSRAKRSGVAYTNLGQITATCVMGLIGTVIVAGFIVLVTLAAVA